MTSNRRAAVSGPRTLIAALIVALAVGPAVLDACVLSCEGASPQSYADQVPACHHAGGATTDSQWQPSVFPCGHDHHAIAATAPVRQAASTSSAGPACVVAIGPAWLTPVAGADVAARARSHGIDSNTPRVTTLRV